jgi:hypothetical protein
VEIRCEAAAVAAAAVAAAVVEVAARRHGRFGVQLTTMLLALLKRAAVSWE